MPASEPGGDLAEGGGQCRLAGQRALQDEGGAVVVGAAVVHQPADDAEQLVASAVRGDRAVELREVGVVDLEASAVAGLVAADDRERVAAAGVGERDPRIGGHRQRHRHAGHDLERDALRVQEQRFFAAAIEEERIAELQARHHLAFAGLLREQVADGVLVGGLTGRPADVDALGAPAAPDRAPAGARCGRR